MAGTQVGDYNGAFTFYSFSYPGNGEIGTFVLNVNPTDSNTTNAVGVNLYLAGTNLLTMNAKGATPGSNSGIFSSTTAGTIVVEVYSYLPNATVSYNFAVTGIKP